MKSVLFLSLSSMRPADSLPLCSMRLIGAPTLADLTPDMVDISNLNSRAVDAAPDFLMRANYEPLRGVGNGLGSQSRL